MYSEHNDKVICVNTGGVPTLTLLKVYEAKVYYTDSPYIGIKDDIGDFRNFKRERFNLLSEYRSNKLNTIGI